MRFATALLLGAAVVSAHPSGHVHRHRAIHEHPAAEKRDDGQVIYATIDGKVVSWTQGGSPFKAAYKPTSAVTSATPPAAPPAAPTTTTTKVAPAKPTTKEAAAPPASPTPVPQVDTASESEESDGGFGNCAASKRATEAQIAYKGNTGCNGYGSNIKLISTSDVSKYHNTIKAVNSGGSAMSCAIWNKIGPTGDIDGFFAKNAVKTFSLAGGSSQMIAVDNNSQGGMCCAPGNKVPTTAYGEFNCPWLEFDAASAANNGWSGFDASALVAGSVGGPFGALKACTVDGSTCSTLNAGGGGSNAYLPGDEKEDGIGGNIPAGDFRVIATWS